MKNIIIIGAGMAGFGASYHLDNAGIHATIYEKETYHGGHAASYYHKGFTYDDGPHISFTKHMRFQKLLEESVNHDYVTFQANVNNYWKGYWIKHPAQCHLYGLPKDLVVNILHDFIDAQTREAAPAETYEQWLLASYGKTFATKFPMQYGIKFHTTTAENMSTDWVNPRFYRPDIKEIIHGAIAPSNDNYHYVKNFRYPAKGGFVTYLDKFKKNADLKLAHNLTYLDPISKQIHFSNGTVKDYDHLISTIPLPELIPLIAGTPGDVLDAAAKLACTACVTVNIGLDREDISEAHWTYFYDHDFIFSRVSYPHMQSANNAPPGMGLIQAEIYYSTKYRPLDRHPDECVQPVIDDLRRCNIIRDEDNIIFSNTKIIPYANVIFDLDRNKALEIIRGYLDDLGIHTCGRYGEWGYHWTDESFMSGENAADKILNLI